MNQKQNFAFYDGLIQNYLEKQATPAEEKQFRLLLGEETFRRRVAEYAIDLGCLYSQASQGMLDATAVDLPEPAARTRRRVLVAAAVAASFLIAVAGLWRFWHQGNSPPSIAGGTPGPGSRGSQTAGGPASVGLSQPSGIALAEGIAGRVVVSSGSDPAKSREVADGTVLESGDTLRTIGENSFAVVKFHDGTILTVTAESQLTCKEVNSQKRVGIPTGEVVAQVARQKESCPMVITTSNAEAEVLGTKLTMYTDVALTELAVHEGKVLFRRIADGQAVNVLGGECAVAAADADLAPRPIQAAPREWDADFESGLPGRWGDGVWVPGERLMDSNGAVRAVRRPEEQGDEPAPCFVTTGRNWAQGLFRVEDDTHLNFRYKLTTPGRFVVRVNARTDGPTATFVGTFVYQRHEMWEIPRNQWQTACIPLSQFRKFDTNPSRGAATTELKTGNVVTLLIFRTQAKDPGLMIDHIWVTRGSPESASVLGPSELPGDVKSTTP